MPTATKHKTRTIYVETLAEVAELFGISVSAVAAWRKDANPMPGTPGRYNVAKIVQWERSRRSANGGVSEELKQAEIRLKTAQARAKEMENDIADGELIDRHDVELWAAEACIAFRVAIMSLPEKIAVSSPPEIRELARLEAERVCRAALIAVKRDLEMEAISETSESE